MESILRFANICGLVSFSVSGFITGQNHRDRLSFVIAAVLTTFAGGAFLRDMLLLGIIPAVLIDRKELYTCIAIAVFLQIKTLTNPSEFIAITNSSAFHVVMLVADALGCGSYLTAGINKGIMFGLPCYLCIAAGIFPAVGGGVFAQIWVGVPIQKALTKDPFYKVMVIILSTRYYQLIRLGENTVNAQAAIIIATMLLFIFRALTEYFIHNLDKLCRHFAQTQDRSKYSYLPTTRELRYCFTYRGIEVRYARFDHLNHAFRIEYHMLLH